MAGLIGVGLARMVVVGSADLCIWSPTITTSRRDHAARPHASNVGNGNSVTVFPARHSNSSQELLELISLELPMSSAEYPGKAATVLRNTSLVSKSRSGVSSLLFANS